MRVRKINAKSDCSKQKKGGILLKRRVPPPRFTFAALLLIAEAFAALILIYILSERIPFFRQVIFVLEIAAVMRIINSDDNPEYKVPWLLVLLILPCGFLAYFLFYSPKPKQEDAETVLSMRLQNPVAEYLESPDETGYLISKVADARTYGNTRAEYISSGEETMKMLIRDLKEATKFIFLEYFIIEDGSFWESVESILCEKSLHGVEVRLIYDDLGCMYRLPRELKKRLGESGVQVLSHSPIRCNGFADFNNRTHRKIAVIDSRCAYTGGVNLTDECIGHSKNGVFKDTAVRIEGNAANELCHLFLCDFALGTGKIESSAKDYYRYENENEHIGYTLPFGDGPNPIYKRRVGKTAIVSLISQAKRYIYITTPYLVPESEICTALENAVLRGVDVRIVIPSVPDKKLVYLLTLSCARRLMDGGVRIFCYLPGFIHSKTYLADGRAAIVGSMNLDFRSLAHNFENGIYFFEHPVVGEIEADIKSVLSDCELMKKRENTSPITRLIRAVIKVFAPLF